MQLTLLTVLLSALAAAAPSTTAKCSRNTFRNGGFESGKLAPWKESTQDPSGSSIGVTSPGFESKHQAYMLPALAPTSGSTPYSQVAMGEAIKVCKNQAYTFSFVYTPSVATDDNAFSAYFDGMQVLLDQSFPTDQPKHFTTTQVAERSEINVSFLWLNFNSTGQPEMYIDDVTFVTQDA